MRKQPFTYLIAASTVFVLLVTGCSSPVNNDLFTETRSQMGTFVQFKVVCDDSSKTKETFDKAFANIDRLSALLTSFSDTSEVALINAQAWQKPVRVSPETFRVIEKSIEISKITKGAFDITISPASRLWKQAQEDDKLPAQKQLDDVRSLIGYDKIILNPRDKTVKLTRKGVMIDLGGIAKGFIVDETVALFRANGYDNGIVNAGGDLYAFGTGGDGKQWKVGLQNPFDMNSVMNVFTVRDRAVVTSGDYRRFFTIEGKRYSHIINPLTARPVAHLPSVTVIGPEAATADALATALDVMGAEGLNVLDTVPGYDAIIIEGDKDNYTTAQSEGFERYIIK